MAIGLQIPVSLSTLQEEGVAKLLEQRASILADPPGAGKTWTTLATLTRDPKGVQRCLVVGPNQVVQQWVDEVEKIADMKENQKDGVRPWVIRHPKSLREFQMMSFVVEPKQALFLFMSPALMTRLNIALSHFRFTHVVLDEVHLYSRPKTKGWASLKNILKRVKSRALFLTANPIQNTFKELESIYELVHTGKEDEVVMPIPIVRRRPDTSYLPKREDIVHHLTLEGDEHESYVRMKEETRDKLSIVQMIKEQMFGLSDESSVKTRKVVEDCVQLKKDGKRTLIVLHRKKHFDVLTSALEKQGLSVAIWNGSINQKRRSELLREWQWVRDNDATAKEILTNTKLGNSAYPNFADLIGSYWQIPDVLLLQSRAGGVGLNLQMYHAVLLPSLDWNPCSEDQAVARVLRRGQKEATVKVIRYILMGTIDERIMERQYGKRFIAASYLD